MLPANRMLYQFINALLVQATSTIYECPQARPMYTQIDQIPSQVPAPVVSKILLSERFQAPTLVTISNATDATVLAESTFWQINRMALPLCRRV